MASLDDVFLSPELCQSTLNFFFSGPPLKERDEMNSRASKSFVRQAMGVVRSSRRRKNAKGIKKAKSFSAPDTNGIH